jgi:hypothetical protein
MPFASFRLASVIQLAREHLYVLLLHGVPLFVAFGPSIFIYTCALVAILDPDAVFWSFYFYFQMESSGSRTLTRDFLAIRAPAPMSITLAQLTSP